MKIIRREVEEDVGDYITIPAAGKTFIVSVRGETLVVRLPTQAPLVQVLNGEVNIR